MGYYRNERGFQGGRRDYGDDRDERGYRAYGGGGSYDRDRGSDFGQDRDRNYRDQYGSYNESGYGGGGYGRSESYSRSRERDNYGRGNYGYGQQRSGRFDASSDYDYDDRGFFSRAGDEVRSWFGDEEAERRRELDARYDERYYQSGDYGRTSRHSDPSYGHWRNRQIAELDRDYDEYRRENQSRFDSEFGTWRTRRSGQRNALGRVNEHMEVVGSDGGHVGTVDKVRGDRIILTKTDSDAGGHHHSIPSAWIDEVDDKVKISKTADEAQRAWRDEEQRGAFFSDGDRESSSARYSRFSGAF